MIDTVLISINTIGIIGIVYFLYKIDKSLYKLSWDINEIFLGNIKSMIYTFFLDKRSLNKWRKKQRNKKERRNT